MISRRKLLQLTLTAVGVASVGGYVSLDDTEVMPELLSLDLEFLSVEQATIVALLMVVVVDHDELANDQGIQIWLTRTDQALAYLPDKQQQDVLMLLDTLTYKLGRLVLTADISKWRRDDMAMIDQVLSLFVRYYSSKSQSDFYLEFGRNDASLNFRDFIMSPEHSRAFIIVSKRFKHLLSIFLAHISM